MLVREWELGVRSVSEGRRLRVSAGVWWCGVGRQAGRYRLSRRLVYGASLGPDWSRTLVSRHNRRRQGRKSR